MSFIDCMMVDSPVNFAIMPETVTLNKSNSIIEVDSYGQVTKEQSLVSLEKINDLLQDPDVNSVLVDVTKQEACSPKPENLAAFAAMLPKGVKIGMLFAKGHPNDSAFTIMTGAAVNNSVSMRMFTSKKDAIQWLTG